MEAAGARTSKRLRVSRRRDPHRQLGLNGSRQCADLDLLLVRSGKTHRFPSPQATDGVDAAKHRVTCDWRSCPAAARSRSAASRTRTRSRRGRRRGCRRPPTPRRSGRGGASGRHAAARAEADRLRDRRQGGAGDRRDWDTARRTRAKCRSGVHTAAKPCWSANLAPFEQERVLVGGVRFVGAGEVEQAEVDGRSFACSPFGPIRRGGRP